MSHTRTSAYAWLTARRGRTSAGLRFTMAVTRRDAAQRYHVDIDAVAKSLFIMNCAHCPHLCVVTSRGEPWIFRLFGVLMLMGRMMTGCNSYESTLQDPDHQRSSHLQDGTHCGVDLAQRRVKSGQHTRSESTPLRLQWSSPDPSIDHPIPRIMHSRKGVDRACCQPSGSVQQGT